MNVTIRYACPECSLWLRKRDIHVTESVINKKISDKEIIIAQTESEIIGWLRFGYFWDNTPFVNMLFIEADHRRKGVGKKLLLYWEAEMKKNHYELVMTSTLSNENAQHFYRKLGYKDAGSLLLPGEPLEIIFIKGI